VHGAWHGPWCFDRLIAALSERGCRAVAVDLPCEDPEAGLREYADVIAAAGGDVVVGHSVSGLPLALVPARLHVYLAAFSSVPGVSMADQFRTSPEPVLLIEGGREIDELGRSRWVDEATTARIMYPDVSPEDAAWAFARLRPQSSRSQREPCPDALPDVESVSVVATDDRVVNAAWALRTARERTTRPPVEIAGGHFAMLTRPDELADALVAVAG